LGNVNISATFRVSRTAKAVRTSATQLQYNCNTRIFLVLQLYCTCAHRLSSLLCEHCRCRSDCILERAHVASVIHSKLTRFTTEIIIYDRRRNTAIKRPVVQNTEDGLFGVVFTGHRLLLKRKLLVKRCFLLLSHHDRHADSLIFRYN